MRDKEPGVQSVDRAVTILEALAAAGSLGITSLAGELGVHKSTASRLVATLESRGLVEQVEERGRYRLGPGVVRLAGATDARLDLVGQARPVLRRLADLCGETVNLAVLSAGAALYVDQQSDATLSGYNWVGQRIPLHATSNGKILVSELSPEDRSAALGELTRYTPATITDADLLDAAIARARIDGYAVATDELDIGLTAVAAPVRDAHGDVAASLSISGPTFKFTAARQAELLDELVRSAHEISTRLGWRTPA